MPASRAKAKAVAAVKMSRASAKATTKSPASTAPCVVEATVTTCRAEVGAPLGEGDGTGADEADGAGGRQSDKASDPAGAVCPAAHTSQPESLYALYIPAGQSLQWLAPVDTPLPSLSLLDAAVKWPALHVLQLESP